MSIKIPSIGDRFGKLVVTSQPFKVVGKSKTLTLLNVKCDCGTCKSVERYSLLNRTKSCGCLQKEIATTHSKSKSKVHRCWRSMKDRCTNPNSAAYYKYGGRGISVSTEWLEFDNFYRDMGDPPATDASLERIDNSKGYYKENVKWANIHEQNNNKRNSIRLNYRGTLYTVKDLAAKFDINSTTLYTRVKYLGMSVEEAVLTPVMTKAQAAMKRHHKL